MEVAMAVNFCYAFAEKKTKSSIPVASDRFGRNYQRRHQFPLFSIRLRHQNL